MIFVPLSLFVPICLAIVLVRLWLTSDLSHAAPKLFAALVAAYALQSLLLSLRWGYGVAGLTPVIAALAPVLPVLAMAAYGSLTGLGRRLLRWLAGIVALNWLVLVVLPAAADALIPMTYLTIGGLLFARGIGGGQWVAAVRVGQVRAARRAMALTGAVLVGSALTDVYIVYDFIANAGRNAPLVIGLAQALFLLVIGVAAVPGGSGVVVDETETDLAEPPAASEDDHAIVARLTHMFERDRLHADSDLNLRRLARRLGLPDRRVSNAINRVTGSSVSQFVNEHRVATVCALLADNNVSILQASLEAGFLTKSNFNREFLRVTGQTPSDWRQSVRTAAEQG